MKVVLESERYTIFESNGSYFYKLAGRDALSRPYNNQEDAELDAWDAYSFQAAAVLPSDEDEDDYEIDAWDSDDDDDDYGS